MQATNEQRRYAQEKEEARAAVRDQRKHSRELPSLGTDAVPRSIGKELFTPGKMDHATCVAYAVGGGSSGRAPSVHVH